MPRSRVIAHDDQIHVPLGGRKDLGHAPRIPTIRASQRPAAKPPKAIVKAAYMRVGRTSGYLAYIERDGSAGPATRDGTTAAQGYSGYMAREGAGEDGQRAELFTYEGAAVDREAFVNRSQGDKRVWTLIVSPGRNDLDMERYIREFMLQLELDLSKPLDWIGATHKNTPYVHSHVLLRGRDRDGADFRIPRSYLSQEMRRRATAIAQRSVELGWLRDPSRSPSMAQAVGSLLSLARWLSVHAREGYATNRQR